MIPQTREERLARLRSIYARAEAKWQAHLDEIRRHPVAMAKRTRRLLSAPAGDGRDGEEA